jgi:nucleotide-binding universal stress UspA family protein
MRRTAGVGTTPSNAVHKGFGGRDASSLGNGRDAAPDTSPIVAAVDGSGAGAAAAETAARLASDLDAPLVFVFVRRRPSGMFAGASYQRRLDDELATARRALDAAHAAADREGIAAGEEIREGKPARRVREFAELRSARLVVLGTRRRRLGRSVSRAIIRAADGPIVVAGLTRRIEPVAT